MTHNIILTTDKEHIITSVYPEQNSTIPFQTDKPLNHDIDKESYDIMMDFLRTLEEEFVALDKTIDLTIDEKSTTFNMYGFKKDDGTTIILTSKENECDRIIEELMRINNNLINQIRKLSKNDHSEDQEAYEKIGRLNSELLNSKRVIEKQHAKLKRYNEILREMSIKDPLTDAYNRRHFYDYCRESLPDDHENETIRLFMIDFNDFKKVNDTKGHDKGDALLRDFVDIVKKSLQGQGEIFRLGGDEFIILLSSAHPDEPKAFMRSIENAFARLSDIASIAWGMTEADAGEIADLEKLEDMMSQADSAMYEHKAKHKEDDR